MCNPRCDYPARINKDTVNLKSYMFRLY